jgi:hypothetical protein
VTKHRAQFLKPMLSAAETVEGSSLSLKSVDNVEGGDGLSLGVFSVHDGVTDDVLEEALEDGTGLLVDVGADSLDTTTASKSADSRLGNAEDGLTESTSVLVSLGAGLAATLAFSASAELSSLCCHLFFCL